MPGSAKPGQDPALLARDHNGLEYDFDPRFIPANVSGKIRGSHSRSADRHAGRSQARSMPLGAADWTPVVRKQDRERWNDWGIGLLLQGDLKGAEYAFRKVTEAEPEYADGWLNVARALIQEGETDAAKPYIAKALGHRSELGAHVVLQSRDPEGGRRLRWRACIARDRVASSIRATAWC